MATRRFALVGYPLTHSFSKAYFTDKFTRERIDAAYMNCELPRLISRDMLPDVEGFNVTIPYKERVMDFLDEVDSDASEIGAVNVVKAIVDSKGHKILKGYNTDASGFRKSLEQMEGFDSEKQPGALILGTGGASKAVAHTLRKMNINVLFVSRQPLDKADTIGYDDLSHEVMGANSLIINCTPVGSFPNVDAAPEIPYHLLSERHFCHDLVYNPGVTKFMKLAESRGAHVRNGAEMLVFQAEEAWKIWNSPIN